MLKNSYMQQLSIACVILSAWLTISLQEELLKVRRGISYGAKNQFRMRKN